MQKIDNVIGFISCCLFFFIFLSVGASGQSSAQGQKGTDDAQPKIYRKEVHTLQNTSKSSLATQQIKRLDCLPPDAQGVISCTEREITNE